ncbi:condensation domain-containing protein [Streptomyces sp. Edi2]|uniref:condensation domain-containing protein n=1 Tax=Streptomyces sp. Edi2 TaxID=3162528 RepID=UPI00330671DF
MSTGYSAGGQARNQEDLLRRFLQRLSSVDPQETITPFSRDGVLPASSAQKRMWFINQLEGINQSYNTPFVLRLRGQLQVDEIRHAIGDLVSRHESLRTTFSHSGDEVIQVIAPSLDLDIPCVDMAGLSEQERETVMQRELETAANRPFKLIGEPLIRATLWRLAPRDHYLMLNIHHIVTDGWSEKILFQELGSLYSARIADREPGLPALDLQYADYAIWEADLAERDCFSSELSYWTEQLKDAPEVLTLPCTRPRSDDASRAGGWADIDLPSDLVAAISKLQQRDNISLFTIAASALLILLHRHSGNEDIIIGAPVANRSRPEWESIVGLFVNTVAIRAEVTSDTPLGDVLRRVRTASVDALSHQRVPFDQVVDALQVKRDAGINPVFQVMCTVNDAVPAPEFPGVSVELEEMRTLTGKFDLEFKAIHDSMGLKCWFEFPHALFDHAVIQDLASDYRTILTALVTDQSRTVESIPGLPQSRTAHSARCGKLVEDSAQAGQRETNPGLESTPNGDRSPTEIQLAAIWSEVLGVPVVPRGAHFFSVGGNSLLATKVILRIRKTWNIEPTVRLMFECPVFEDLAVRIGALVKSAQPGSNAGI